jgi:hypothetical protein
MTCCASRLLVNEIEQKSAPVGWYNPISLEVPIYMFVLCKDINIIENNNVDLF